MTLLITLTDVIEVVEEAGSETVGKGEDDGGGQPAPEDILVTQVMEHCWLEEWATIYIKVFISTNILF